MEELEFIEKRQQVLWKAEAEQAQSGILSWRMLENNEIKGLLPFDYYYVDSRIHFYYACQPLQKLGDYFEKKEGDFDTLHFICLELLNIILRGQEYLLGGGGYLIAPEWIFWSQRERRLALCYLPGGERELDKDYIKLVEFLMQHTNHKDKEAVEMIYQLYDILHTEGFVPEQLQQYLEEQRESGNQVQEEVRNKRVKETKSDTQGSVKEMKIFYGTKKPYQRKSKSFLRRTQNQRSSLIVCASKAGVTASVNERTAYTGGNNKKGSLDKEERDFQYFLKPIATEKNSGLQKQIILANKEAVLPLSFKETTIGRQTEARLDSSFGNGLGTDLSVINLPFSVISRRHALFLYERGQLFIMDTESQNGTYLNGNKISAYVKTRCKTGDVITFADISFQIFQNS